MVTTYWKYDFFEWVISDIEAYEFSVNYKDGCCVGTRTTSTTIGGVGKLKFAWRGVNLACAYLLSVLAIIQSDDEHSPTQMCILVWLATSIWLRRHAALSVCGFNVTFVHAGSRVIEESLIQW
jgi:hypothetical protein